MSIVVAKSLMCIGVIVIGAVLAIIVNKFI